MKNSIIEVSVRKPIAITMLLMIVMFLGLFSFYKLPVDFLPSIQKPVLTIETSYKNAGPEEIEASITKPIENAVSSIDNVEKIYGTSREGRSLVRLIFDWNIDLNSAMFQIQEQLDLIRKDLPTNASEPVLYKINSEDTPIMGLIIQGIEDPRTAYEIADNIIIPSLKQVKGVGQVTLEGGTKSEIHVDISQERLLAYKMHNIQIADIIKKNNQELSGGYIFQGIYRYRIRANNKLHHLRDLQSIPLAYRNDFPIELHNIADASFSEDHQATEFYANNIPALAIFILKASGENTVQVSYAVRKKLKQLKNTLPPNVKLIEYFNNADTILDAQKALFSSLLLGCIFAMIVLLLFLGDWKTLIIIGLAIPTSLITTFIAMYFFNTTLNIISLSGLALGVGMMVDSSIVVLENIFKHRSQGKKKYSAAIAGANEVLLAITASTLTTIAVFLPIFLINDYTTQLFRDFAVTIVISLITSLIIAITIVPMLSSLLIKKTPPNFEFSENLSHQSNKKTLSIKIITKISEWYYPILLWSLKHKKLLIIGSLFGASILSVIFFIRIPKEQMPTSEGERAIIYLNFPEGTRSTVNKPFTKNISHKIQKSIGSNNYKVITTSVQTKTGSLGVTQENRSQIGIMLPNKRKNTDSMSTIIHRIQEVLKPYPIQSYIYILGESRSGNKGESIQLEIRGDNTPVSEKVADAIVNMMKTNKNFINPRRTDYGEAPEIKIIPDRIAIAKAGISIKELFYIIQSSFASKSVSEFLTPTGTDIEIIVKMHSLDKESISRLQSLHIQTRNNQTIPLKSLVSFKVSPGASRLFRIDRTRYVSVRAGIKGNLENNITKAVDYLQKEINHNIYLPPDVHLVFTGSYEDTKKSIQGIIFIFFIAVFIVYALMAAQFESYLAPLVIMAAIPYGSFGALGLLILSGSSLNTISGAGIIILIGIVINNGIVLIDYMNHLLQTGYSPDDAALKSGLRRLRPVLMTTLTTLCGMIPIVFSKGVGNSSYSSLAIAVLGGLSISTLFTLIVVPTCYAAVRKRFPYKIPLNNTLI